MTGLELPFIGLLISLAVIALTGVYPGGLIIPSYLVLFINQPARLACTVAAALLTWVCFRLASQWLILFGKRRMVFMVLMGALWAQAGLYLVPSMGDGLMDFRVIGWVIPGLIANQCERQGPVLTVLALTAVTAASYAAGTLLGMV